MYNALRRIDYFFGKACYYLRWLLFLKCSKRIAEVEIKKILCIKLWGLGNLAIIYPLILKIKEKFPKAKLIFVTFDLNNGFLENNKAVDSILYFPFSRNIFKLINEALLLIKKLRKENIDLVINFEFFNNAAACFSCLIGAPLRIGRDTRDEGIFYTHPISQDNLEHISERFCSLLKPLGTNTDYAYACIEGTSEDKKKIEYLLDLFSVEKFICIHPGASDNFRGKVYHKDCFAELAKMFVSIKGFTVIFIGQDKKWRVVNNADMVVSAKRKIIDLTNQLTIGELVELLRKSKLLVSNDTGPVHIAASLGINTAVLYGPTSPRNYKPLNSNSLVFYKNLFCSPCVGIRHVNRRCNNNFICMDFSLLEIYEGVVRKFLND